MKPDDHDHEEVRTALQRAFPPVDTDLHRDLWPAMLRRMSEATGATPVPWYDWVLAGCVAVALVVFPKLVVLFAYHL